MAKENLDKPKAKKAKSPKAKPKKVDVPVKEAEGVIPASKDAKPSTTGMDTPSAEEYYEAKKELLKDLAQTVKTETKDYQDAISALKECWRVERSIIARRYLKKFDEF